MGKLIIDITYLAHWQGKLTGIPRVIHELIVRYMEHHDCVFVVWDNRETDFYEVDIAKTLQNRGVSLHYLPALSKGTTRQGIYRASTFSGRVARKLQSDFHLPIPALLTGITAEFKKPNWIEGDTLLLTMGEWANPAYAPRVLQLGAAGINLVQISYDMLPLVAPQYSGHSTQSMYSYCHQVFPQCQLILAISKHTKLDVEKWLRSMSLPVPPVQVFRLGDDFQKAKPAKPADATFKASKLKGGDYILCVGTIEARKNHTLLYYTYKLGAQKGFPCQS